LTDTSAYGVVALDSVMALSPLAALCLFQDVGATDAAGAGASSSDDAWAALNAAVEATLLSVQNLVKEGETPYWGHGPPPTPLAAAPTPSTDALAVEGGVPAASGDRVEGDDDDDDEEEVEVINVAQESGERYRPRAPSQSTCCTLHNCAS
jgi:hypothetical protein